MFKTITRLGPTAAVVAAVASLCGGVQASADVTPPGTTKPAVAKSSPTIEIIGTPVPLDNQAR